MAKKLWKKINIVTDVGNCRYCKKNIVNTDSFVSFYKSGHAYSIITKTFLGPFGFFFSRRSRARPSSKRDRVSSPELVDTTVNSSEKIRL